MASTPTVNVDQPLRIALISPPWQPIPPTSYGGVERIIVWLAEELIALGHEVTIFGAGPDNIPKVRYYATFDDPPPKMAGTEALAGVIHMLEVARLLNTIEVDVIHDHSILGAAVVAARGTPIVTTAHNPVYGYIADLKARYYQCIAQSSRLIAISETQRSRKDSDMAVSWAGIVPNGIPVDNYPLQTVKKDYALWLGRMTEEKAPELAISAARTAGIPLILAGKCVEPDEHAYFDEHVRPLLGPDVEWVGEVGGTDKLNLLAQARCLLNPLQWNEPFGLVMVEAMACGTPVVAMNRGAASELVLHEVTGYLCDTAEELASWIPRVGELDPASCRKHVETHFSSTRMAEGYLTIYREAIQAQRK